MRRHDKYNLVSIQAFLYEHFVEFQALCAFFLMNYAFYPKLQKVLHLN
ncbi:hypothetical protein A28LD_0552 [Idiomarina sp. A28L]|nr:hypothetical protein A28LD_0552 [Idiomarina sp. A28L]